MSRTPKSRVTFPVTEADWAAWDRGEWPPKRPKMTHPVNRTGLGTVAAGTEGLEA